MDANQALELEFNRKRTLVTIDNALPEGRKSGELSALTAIVKQQHKLLTRYDAMKEPPAIAENMAAQFAAYVARIEELIAAKSEG